MYVSQAAVKATLDRWASESAIYFCRLAQQGCEFQNITYPTGLNMVRATRGAESAEVPLQQAKVLRESAYRCVKPACSAACDMCNEAVQE